MESLITFSDVLKVSNVVRNIAFSLNPADYISFRQINKKVYHDHLTGATDKNYWLHRVKCLGLEPEPGYRLPSDVKVNAANIGVTCTKFDPRDPKVAYKLFYRLLHPFVKRLYHNDVANFFPEEYNEPLTQAKIIKVLEKYINSYSNDWPYHRKVQENLKIFKELFTTSVIRELDLNFDKKNFSYCSQFVEVLLLLDHEVSAVDFFKSKNEFPESIKLPQELFDENDELRYDQLELALDTFTQFLNEKISITDQLFQDRYPVIVLYTENFVQDHLIPYFQIQISSSNTPDAKNKRLMSLPTIYSKLSSHFVKKLRDNVNAGTSYQRFVSDFIQLYLEPEIQKFFDTMVQDFTTTTEDLLKDYEEQSQRKQKAKDEALFESLKNSNMTNEELLDGKTNFLKSFTKIFKINNNTLKSQAEQDLEVSYTLQKMNNKLQNITSLVSLDLCYKIIQACREHMEKIYLFKDVEVFETVVKLKCQEMYKILMFLLSEKHIKLGFETALQLLKDYDANETKLASLSPNGTFDDDNKVEPLVQFTELINIGDIILQMLSIFYNNELIAKGIIDKNKDIFNDVVHTKKVFETMLDDYVANGLNIGIDKLMDQVEFTFSTMQFPDDFNPDPKDASRREIAPSKCAIANVELLSEHCFLLTGATDKGTIDVFQQEIGERFFDEVVKNIKKHLISEDGAVFLIADLNYYHDFISKKTKQKNITPFFLGLKSVGQLYLISGKDSKELGKLICDVGKFQGVFTQEEIYELVQRRTDWFKVRKDVEKVMYGLGVSDCVIC
uniref:F-box protein involved in recycling plasma membrane proteins internalized by endocytosis n=1 Tax=Kluyveromyces marxianus TaxID=4911 RepID=F4NCP3_KLUMA|nr:F-box protein involved in recycling plasma membrane proteins internalized by endocytosis [Kluyveromyces marxianus]CCA89272.1 F-box protein involved in recycling plasma membrane proteins internalized by endocytosis [Kluyveromyces marxianus]